MIVDFKRGHFHVRFPLPEDPVTEPTEDSSRARTVCVGRSCFGLEEDVNSPRTLGIQSKCNFARIQSKCNLATGQHLTKHPLLSLIR